jgi:glycosyltransferase 2 family protein
MEKRMNRKGNLLKWMLITVIAVSFVSIAGYLLPAMVRDAGKLESRFGDLQLTFLAIAFSLALISRPVNAIGWRLVLSAFGCALRWGTAVRIWLMAEACRWLPGGIWHVGSRTVQSTIHGIPPVIGVASVALELVLTIIASMLLAVIGIIIYGSHILHVGDFLSWRAMSIGILAMIGFALLGIASYFALRYLLPKKYDSIRERLAALRQVHPRAWPTAGCLAFYMFFAFLNGLAFYATVETVAPNSGVPLFAAIVINALAWVVSLNIFIMAPAGLGVREAMLTLQLSVWIKVADAILIAVLWRFLLVSVELICLLAAYSFPMMSSGLAHFFGSRTGHNGFEKNEEELKNETVPL